MLIHHLPGYDRWSKEVARRFATDGYPVLLPNLYSREAPGADPDDAAAVARKRGGVPDERLVGDVGAAADHLRGLPASNGKVAVIGHCSGGRQAVLAGCNLDLQGVVDCYGAFVVGTPPADYLLRVSGLEDQLVNLSCPLLGMFGNDDSYPSPAAGRRAGPVAHRARQGARAALLRRRRTRLLLHRPAVLPARAGRGRLRQDRELLRPDDRLS